MSYQVQYEDINTGNQTLQAIISKKSSTILKGENSSMSLFQLYKSVSSVLNQETREESINSTLRTDTRKEVRCCILPLETQSPSLCYFALLCHLRHFSVSHGGELACLFTGKVPGGLMPWRATSTQDQTQPKSLHHWQYRSVVWPQIISAIVDCVPLPQSKGAT